MKVYDYGFYATNLCGRELRPIFSDIIKQMKGAAGILVVDCIV